MICTMLDFVKPVSLDIWHIERYVCFWLLWFSKLTISSTIITFSSVRVCSLLVSCFWSMLHISQISSKEFKNSASILQKLYFFKPDKFLIRALPLLLNGTLHHQYIFTALKIII